MSIEPQYRELFSETVTLFPPVTRDAYGGRTYGASVSAPAHLVAETKMVRTPDGREIVQKGKVYLYGEFSVTTAHKIELADGSVPLIIAVDTPHDEVGLHHTVISIGDTQGA
jgi:hypothetical protein